MTWSYSLNLTSKTLAFFSKAYGIIDNQSRYNSKGYSMPQVEAILKKDKQHKIFKELLEVFNKLAKKNYKCSYENAYFFHKQAEPLRKAYANSKVLFLKGKDVTSQKVEDALCALLEDVCSASSLLSILKVDKQVVEKLRKEIPNIDKVVKNIEEFRIKFCEEKYELSNKLALIHQKIQQLVDDIENIIQIDSEDYNRNISIIIKDDLIKEIKFKTDRPSFESAIKNFFGYQKNGKEDIRHWKSNEVIKQEIKSMFEGQPFTLVAECLVERNYSKEIKDNSTLQDAIYNLWRTKFNERNNLRLGDSQANQALGRLIPRLKDKIEQGETKFVPFTLNMSEFDFNIEIKDWQMLKDFYFNANFDFTFDEKTMPEQLHQAASEFNFAYKC